MFAISGFSQAKKLKNSEMIEWITDSTVYEQDSTPRVYGKFVITIPDTSQQLNFTPAEVYQTTSAIDETIKENVFIVNSRAIYNRDSLHNKQAKNLSKGKINRELRELSGIQLEQAKWQLVLKELNK